MITTIQFKCFISLFAAVGGLGFKFCVFVVVVGMLFRVSGLLLLLLSALDRHHLASQIILFKFKSSWIGNQRL